MREDTTTATLPGVAVVVPAHRPTFALRRCLAALAALDPAPQQLVVVVDGADPEVVALARAVAGTVLALPEAGGPAAARNAGVAATDAEVVLFLDSDVLAPPGLVGGVQRYLADHPEVDALMGSYDDAPEGAGAISQYKNLLNHWVHHHGRREASTFWGACGAVRRRAFDRAGGFDEAYTRPCIEDIELGYRLRDAGSVIHLVPALQVTHLKRWDARGLLRADVLDRAVPWAELLLQRGRAEDDLNISRVQRGKVVLALLSALAALASPVRREARWAAAAGLVGLGVADRRLIAFFAGARGPRFAAVATAWHWFSYLYSAAGLAIAAARVLSGRAQPARGARRGRRSPPAA